MGKDVFDLSRTKESIASFIASRIDQKHETGSFLITNLASIASQFMQWKQELPMVQPFYAVKCNPDPVMLRLLAKLGCSFDCATKGEIEMVVEGLGEELSFKNSGRAPTSIVYANPAKMQDHVIYAIQNGVQMTVFDGEDELVKLAAIPNAKESLKLLLRIKTDDKASLCRFSHKFGCHIDDAPELIQMAHKLGLHVAGVSFHVGSGCGDGNAYVTALKHARNIFDLADKEGMQPMSIVDIGGGFPGDSGGYGGPGMPTFQELSSAIRSGIAQFFVDFSRPADSVRFIAEPGRYFASAATTVATKVYARKGGKHNFQALYVDDGVYGSFNNVVYDHCTLVPLKLASLIRAEKATAEKEDNDSKEDTCGKSRSNSSSVAAAAVVLTAASVEVNACASSSAPASHIPVETARATKLQDTSGTSLIDDGDANNEDDPFPYKQRRVSICDSITYDDSSAATRVTAISPEAGNSSSLPSATLSEKLPIAVRSRNNSSATGGSMGASYLGNAVDVAAAAMSSAAASLLMNLHRISADDKDGSGDKSGSDSDNTDGESSAADSPVPTTAVRSRNNSSASGLIAAATEAASATVSAAASTVLLTVNGITAKGHEDDLIPTAVFGPTCDGLDQMCALENTFLPRCEIGDWLIWENMGAYTHTASFTFNGYTHIPRRTYCML